MEGPLWLLREAIKANPSLRYAFGVVGIVAAVNIVGALVQQEWRIAVYGTALMFIAMVVLTLFARIHTLPSKILHPPIRVLLWSSVVLIILVAYVFFISAFFQFPSILASLTSKTKSTPTIDATSFKIYGYADHKETNYYVFVLVDLSASFFDKTSLPKTKRSLERIFDGLRQYINFLPAPVKIFVLPITDASLQGQILCSTTYKPTLIPPSKGDGDVIYRNRDFGLFLDKCLNFILKQKPSDFTDISGAIIHASNISRQRKKLLNTLIVLSDMEEESPRKQIISRFSLQGFCVTLVYRPIKKDILQPGTLQTRIDGWKHKLTDSGAESVSTYIESGIDPATMVDELTNCIDLSKNK